MAKANGKAQSSAGSLQYVRCQVEPGMFRGEWLVHLDTIDPRHPSKEVRVQLLADDREVSGVQGTPARHRPVPGLLRITFVKPEAEFAWIVLP
jgi:hypothetical protein